MSGEITKAVKQGYGAVARSGLSSENEGIARVAKAFGYTDDELSSIPAEANMGLSCGNPTAMASLNEGEVVVDLGSGGGLDVFLAAEKVGATGKAIGIDMTMDMISLARKNAEKAGHKNVEFHLAEIVNMPLEDDSVDCIISNCVLNLVEEKDAAFREIFRVLKPGGRLAVSDIALKKELPEMVREDLAAWTACISGAISIDDNRAKLLAAGFSDIELIDAGSDLNAYKEGGAEGCCAPVLQEEVSSSCCGPAKAEPVKVESEKSEGSACCAPTCCDDESEKTGAEAETEAYHEYMARLMEDVDFNEYAASVKMFAIKS